MPTVWCGPTFSEACLHMQYRAVLADNSAVTSSARISDKSPTESITASHYVLPHPYGESAYTSIRQPVADDSSITVVKEIFK